MTRKYGSLPEVTEEEFKLLMTLGYQRGVSYRKTIDDAVAYFEEITSGDAYAFIGLSVFLNTFLLQVIRDWDVTPKEKSIISPESAKEPASTVKGQTPQSQDRVHPEEKEKGH